MSVSVKLIKFILFKCLWLHTYSHIQFDDYPQATVCGGDNVNLIWKYTSNETILTIQWYKMNSPDVLIAGSVFGFTPQGAYVGRVTQAPAFGNAAITLRSVTAADNGTYKCSVNTLNVETRGYLIVAEAPSGLPYFTMTTDSLICNPPMNEGLPKVQTVLKANDGTILTHLTVQSSGNYNCCIVGDAVRCLGLTRNFEICVNEIFKNGPTMLVG